MPLQTHIRSPLLTAAPISRLRRARAQEGGTILFFGQDVQIGFHRKFPFVDRYPRSEPVCMTRPVSDAASNSHPVAAFNGRTNIPLASGEGSGGRDHSLLRPRCSDRISS